MFDYNALGETYTALGFPAEVVSALTSMASVLDKHKLTDAQKDTVFALLSDAGRESVKDVPEKALKGEWRDFDYGNVTIGNYVRVKPDAYDSESGAKHNGRVGILKYMAHNRCTVDYVGAELGEAMAHPMTNLESLRLL